MRGFSLRVLGPFELTGPDGVSVQSVTQQPKRAALLAVLATGPNSSRSRSELLDLFWRDSSAEDGRHALSQALYYLRRSLGRSSLVVQGDQIRLAPDIVASDLASFRQSLEAGRHEEAVALVRGELLEQFASIPDFDQWLDGAREAVRQQALDALDHLWRAADAAGDHTGAIRWAQRAAALAPYDELPVRRLLTSLTADAQPVRARDVFERYAATLRRDLELEPSEGLAALLDAAPRIDQPVSPASAAAIDAPRAHPPAVAIDAPPHLPVTEPGTEEVEAAPVATLSRARWRRWGSGALISAAALALVLALAADGLGVFRTGNPAAGAVAANRVGIFPFSYRGAPERAYLADGIPELIGISIQSLDQVSMIDPRALDPNGAGQDLGAPALTEAAGRARALGAGYFLVGSVVEAGGHIHVTARLHRTAGDVVAAVSDRADTEEAIFDLVDGLTRQLIAHAAFPGPSDLERSAALTSGSLPALRHFFRGERLFRSGRYPDAVAAFEAAVSQDSTFALAMYRGAIAQLWSGDADFGQARAKVTRALEHRKRVSSLEADLFLALHEFLRGRLLQAERLYESVLMRQPENVEAWFQLAETRFHYGALHGRSTTGAATAWRQVLSLNPEHHAGLIHLSAISALLGEPALDSLEERVNSGGDAAAVATPQVRALKVFSSGSEADRRRFLDMLRRYDGGAVSSSAAYAARYLRDPLAGARIAAVLTDPIRPSAERADGHLLMAHFAVARGRRTEARRELEHARRLDPGQAELHSQFLGSMPPVTVELRSRRGVPALVPTGLPARVATTPRAAFDGTIESGLRLYANALAYHQAGGEAGALVSAARQLATATTDEGTASMLNVLALGLMAERDLRLNPDAPVRDDLARAIKVVESWYENLRADYLRSLARERFLLAEAEIRNGLDVVAGELLTPIGENSVAELPYLGASLIRMGEILERQGDPAAAATAYRRVLDLWADAEPDYDAVKEEISARIGLLDN